MFKLLDGATVRYLEPHKPTFAEVAKWPEWKAFAKRLGIPDLPATGISIDMQLKQPVKVTATFQGADLSIEQMGVSPEFDVVKTYSPQILTEHYRQVAERETSRRECANCCFPEASHIDGSNQCPILGGKVTTFEAEFGYGLPSEGDIGKTAEIRQGDGRIIRGTIDRDEGSWCLRADNASFYLLNWRFAE